MTDAEIIKALEYCGDGGFCSKCSFHKEMETVYECTTELAKAALDLIQRQQERIGALKFCINHESYRIVGQLEELKQFYKTSDIKIGLEIAIDVVKGGVTDV